MSFVGNRFQHARLSQRDRVSLELSNTVPSELRLLVCVPYVEHDSIRIVSYDSENFLAMAIPILPPPATTHRRFMTTSMRRVRILQRDWFPLQKG